MKVLIVDDEPANRALIRAVLEREYDVHEAADAASGLEAARAHLPALIIVDLFMPRASGTDFIRTVRADERLRKTRIALYTGSNLDGALSDFMEAYGVRHVVPKPGEPEEIIDAVRAALA